jgi:hypothetical protein
VLDRRADNKAMTPAHKEWIFYGAATLAVLLNEIATKYGVEMLTLFPLLLGVWGVWIWAFNVK